MIYLMVRDNTSTKMEMFMQDHLSRERNMEWGIFFLFNYHFNI